MRWNKQTPDGTKNVSVGKIIALLAEEGDDISNLEAPKEEKPAPQKTAAPPPTPLPQPTQSSSPPPSSEPKPTQTHTHAHAKPLFPSVHRLLLEHASSIPSVADIKGTGMRGMLTKGDVLAFLGKASGPLGSYEGKEVKSEMKVGVMDGSGGKVEEVKVGIILFCFDLQIIEFFFCSL